MDTKKLRAKDLMQTDVKMVHKDVTLLTVVKMMRDLGVSSKMLKLGFFDSLAMKM
jgi:predicted transcriptional regulator